MRTVLKGSLLLIAAVATAGVVLLVHEEGRSHTAAISSATSLPTVTTEHPKLQKREPSLTLPATVSAWEEAPLYVQVSGYLDQMQVDIGSRVRKGEVMAHIAVPEMQQSFAEARARLEEAQASEQQAEQTNHLKQLSSERLSLVQKNEPDLVAEQDVDTASTESQVARGALQLAKAHVASAKAEIGRLQALLDYSTIRAPFSGIVTQRSVNPGDLIQNASNSNTGALPLFTVARTDVVRIFLDIPEPEVPFINRGAPVAIRLDALPGHPYTGAITRSAESLDPQSRTMRSEVDLPNPKGTLKAGMFGSASVRLRSLSGSVVLPSAALHQAPSNQTGTAVDENHRNYVYAVRNHRAYRVYVNPLFDDGIQASVNGLSTSDDVVVGASETLADGMLVQANNDHQNTSQ